MITELEEVIKAAMERISLLETTIIQKDMKIRHLEERLKEKVTTIGGITINKQKDVKDEQ